MQLARKIGGGATIKEIDSQHMILSNGLKIAWGSFSFTTNGFGNAGGLYYSDVGISISLGVSFSSIYSFQSTPIPNLTNPLLEVQINPYLDKIASVRGIHANNTNTSYTVKYLIIGV